MLETPNEQFLSHALPIAALGGLLVFMAMGGLAIWRHSVIRLLLYAPKPFQGERHSSSMMLALALGCGVSVGAIVLSIASC